jgi:cytochrome P450
MDQVTSKGIAATFEPVDWAPEGLPTDPADIVRAIEDPAQRGEVYPLLHQLRREAPVFHCPPDVMHGVWVLTRFADIEGVLMNTSAVNDPKVVDTAFNHGDGSFYSVMKNAMIFADVDSHKRMRKLVVRAFTPRAMSRWRPITEGVANQLCDELAEAGADGEPVDLVQRYNYQLPFNVIAHILGVPEADFPLMRQLAWDFARAGESMVSPEVAASGDEAARGFMEYFGDLAERRRSDPGDDLISGLVQVEEEGDRLSLTELVANCILLMQAGHETTQDLLGNAEVALFRHPDQLALLRDHPEVTKEAVEEALRYDTSVQINHRLVLEDLTIEDHTIPEGSMVYSFLGAANRDSERFDEPDRLDLQRPNNQHVAFVVGTYYCVGAALARTEIGVGLRTLLDRFPDLQPAGDGFEWRETLLLRGPQRLEATL